jgi:hypothetical protein
MNERDDYTKSEYKRMLQFAIEGFRKFSLYHIPCIQHKWLPVNQDIFSVNFPDDLVKLYSVGVAIEGRYWDFTRTDERIIPQCKTIDPDRGEADQRIHKPIENYGMQGGFNRYLFTEDTPNRRIIIFGPRTLEVLIYYKSTGINMDGTTVVPIHAFEALKAYVLYKLSVFSDTAVNRVQFLQTNYLSEVKDMRDFENMFTVNEFLDAIRSGYAQTFKR